MEVKSEPWSIDAVKRRESKINPSPPYQRGPVWSLAKKQLLIDSILRGMDIPKLYLRSSDRGPYSYEIIDGKQRLTAIWEFCRKEYSISKDADPVERYEVAGKLFDGLQDELQDRFCGYPLSFVIISRATDEQIEEMFLRLNNGESLRAAEKRNAMPGKLRDQVKSLARHSFFKCVGFENIRYAYDALTAQMILLEAEGAPCNIRDGNLRRMYEEHRKSGIDDPLQKKVKRVLNFLAKSFAEKTPELKKVNAISLYLLGSQLLETYAISGTERAFRNWYLEFEETLRAEMDKEEDKRDPELIAYQKAITQATNDVDSVKRRHETLLTRYLLGSPEIELLDTQREFTEHQRLAIYRRDKGRCRGCNKEVKFYEEFHADHVTPHKSGGKTTVINGQLLCRECNLRKGGRG